MSYSRATARRSLIVSDFAAAEFCVRDRSTGPHRELPPDEARIALADFDAVVAITALDGSRSPQSMSRAPRHYVRRLDLPLRTPDAIHIAVAQRLGATLVTFDRAHGAAARTLGVAVADV